MTITIGSSLQITVKLGIACYCVLSVFAEHDPVSLSSGHRASAERLAHTFAGLRRGSSSGRDVIHFTDLYAHTQISICYISNNAFTDSSTHPQIRRHIERFLH